MMIQSCLSTFYLSTCRISSCSPSFLPNAQNFMIKTPYYGTNHSYSNRRRKASNEFRINAASISAHEQDNGGKEALDNDDMRSQLKKILAFTGPAAALGLCGPLMSLIDTAVIGQGSSLELAALGPGTVICDYIGYLFAFIPIAASNFVATSLARKDQNDVQHHISMLVAVGIACGLLLLLLTRVYGSRALIAFVGRNNQDLIAAANTYVQIRSLAWPVIFVGWVAQSASLGMRDSWGPLKALAAATIVNGTGDIILCIFLGYGIAGAAWATMASQVVSSFMMIENLMKKGYKPFQFSVPTVKEGITIVSLAAPVLLMMVSKVAFWSLMTYFATSLGSLTVAAHQVMIQTFSLCSVWGTPISQTAQAFLPEYIYGDNKNLKKAKKLLISLLSVGAALGLALSFVEIVITLFFPIIFTHDHAVIAKMHTVIIPSCLSVLTSPCNQCLEGALMAVRDFNFVSQALIACFFFGFLALWIAHTGKYGLPGIWLALVVFQLGRFVLFSLRLFSPKSILADFSAKHV